MLGFSQINLENHSLIRIFELRSKIGYISEIKINMDLFCISLNLHYLCSDDRVHPTDTTAAMAKERVCLCADFLQQQPVEARILLAHIGGVCLVLFGVEQHLLL